jgi:hypothetical protein
MSAYIPNVGPIVGAFFTAIWGTFYCRRYELLRLATANLPKISQSVRALTPVLSRSGPFDGR